MDRCCSQAGNNSKYFELGMEQHHSCLLGANANVMFAFAWYELNKMRALLVVCLVTMLCGVLAKNKKSDDSKVKIAVYYESLCPDSKKFITSQLAPVWRDLRGAVKVKLVPYGKATHDKIQACILKDRSLQDTDKMEMVICLMGEAHPDKSVDTVSPFSSIVQIGGKEFENERMFRCREFRLFPIPVLLKYPEYLIPVILKLTKKRRHRSLAAMIGREDREDALLKSALQADERVRVVSEHLTECLMLLEEAPNPEDKELVEGDVSQCLELAQDIAQAAADISRRRDGKEKPFRGKVGQGLQVPLPPVTVPVFAGDYADWPAFEDLYSSVVHTRTDITPAYKMAQLMSRLHGEPHELLTHLAVSDSNYEVAWKILTDRYRNKRLIVDRLLDQWLSIPTITRVLLRLPSEMVARFEQLHGGKSSDHLPTYEDLKSFLEAESRRVDVQAGEAPRKETSALATRNGRVHRREEATVGNPGGTTPHWNQGVPTAGRQATGWQRVRSLLRSGFRGDGVWHSRGVGVFGAWGRIRCECPSSTNCRYCQGAHHPLLCMNRSGGAGGSAGSDQRREPAHQGREQRSPPPSRRSPPPRRSQGQAGDVNRRSPLTQGRGDDPHHGSRCRIGEERHRNVARTPIPGTGFNGRVSGGTRQPPGYMQYSAGLSHLVGSQDPRMPPPMPEYPRLQAQPRYGRLPSGYYRTPAMAFMGRPPYQQEWDPYTGLGSEDTPRDAASPRLDSR
ncbi:gamma interferon inducible lysosomal thiol reductase (GILT) domain-containing protein [Phthorimaea operculella]|nr:gamma interferon inducible lysosomal thiol reductase (GILT) domain-containing protein [Phthorimaea operculella]